MNWEDIRYVMVIERCGTLTAAAVKLEVDQTTVSRRLKMIENKLAKPLFLRSGAELVATEACRRITAYAMKMDEQFHHLLDEVAAIDGDPCGVVRVSAMPWIVNDLIMPALPSLVAKHPNVGVETISSVRDRNLLRGEADISLRFELMPKRDELCRPLGKIEYSLYAKKNSDSENLPWIGYGEDVAQMAPNRWAKKNSDTIVVRANDAGASLRAVEHGVGKALLPDILASRSNKVKKISDPGKPELVRILRMMVHPDIARYRHVEIVMRWLSDLVKSV